VHLQCAPAARGLAQQAVGLQAPAHDLARGDDVLLGGRGEEGVARRVQRLGVGVDAFDQLLARRAW